MTRTSRSIYAIAIGVLLMVAGIFGWFGDVSGALLVIGALTSLLGWAGLASTQSRDQLTVPHPAFYGLLALAIIPFHVYQNVTMLSRDFSAGWFLWALSPYVLVLVLSCFQTTRIPAIAGAALALAVDMWSCYEVARSTSSTAVLDFIWIPIWDTLIVVPIGTFVGWLALRPRQASRSSQ